VRLYNNCEEVKHMQQLGFVHDMMDIKMLILFVLSRANYPMTVQEIHEVCYQDDGVSYFDICTAIPEMVTSGHLQQVDEQSYIVTEKGCQDGQMTENSIAFTVRQRAEDAIFRFNARLHRSAFIKTDVISKENGEYSVQMTLDNETGRLMTLKLMAPNQRQAIRLEKLLENKAEDIYNLTMIELLDEENSI